MTIIILVLRHELIYIQRCKMQILIMYIWCICLYQICTFNKTDLLLSHKETDKASNIVTHHIAYYWISRLSFK